jgi:hypothetical protein
MSRRSWAHRLTIGVLEPRLAIRVAFPEGVGRLADISNRPKKTLFWVAPGRGTAVVRRLPEYAYSGPEGCGSCKIVRLRYNFRKTLASLTERDPRQLAAGGAQACQLARSGAFVDQIEPVLDARFVPNRAGQSPRAG